MEHTLELSKESHIYSNKSLIDRAMGKFYTHPFIANQLAGQISQLLSSHNDTTFSLIDPFCGDGRLITCFLQKFSTEINDSKVNNWKISLWDYDNNAVEIAREKVFHTVNELKICAEIDSKCHDSLVMSKPFYDTFDCVITNPPWEALKPDQRELSEMSPDKRENYRCSLKEYDKLLASTLPLSQPIRKFAGWGTNLSRCGTEVALNLTSKDGLCGIVAPSSLLTDQMTSQMREWMFNQSRLLSVAYYPAEARLFKSVDQPCISIILKKTKSHTFSPEITKFNKDCEETKKYRLKLSAQELKHLDYSIPVEYGKLVIKKLAQWSCLNRLSDLEGKETGDLWAGRELDETGYKGFLAEAGKFAFIKGRMIGRYTILEQPTGFVREDLRKIPDSATHPRIVWRDVSRRSQARRMQATIIPSGFVTGNSLHVAFLRNDDMPRLRALLSIMNSIPFEFQVRSRLGTGHISLGVVRQVYIPDINDQSLIRILSETLSDFESGNADAEVKLEIIVAQAYGIKKSEYQEILQHFERLSPEFKSGLLSHPMWRKNHVSFKGNVRKNSNDKEQGSVIIPNHYSAKLSDLDMQMAVSIPPGGNWKNIPESIPSNRLKSIRESYAKGKGSRSTYYGRLHPDHPSYTINTHFGRPGNGCHLHYDYDGKQHRVLSQREAARLQSFPDNFVFTGSRTAISQQIGNAVPPLLAYQIAKQFPEKGQFIDLFSGAGGMSLGFKLAGWEPIVANDIVESFLETYKNNIHEKVLCGDIREKDIFNEIVKAVHKARQTKNHIPLLVLGGPPCQGFSTAGNRRSMDDDRNKLFYEYKAMLEKIQPNGFVFENVTGLLNMEGGRVFELIKNELKTTASKLTTWKLQAEQFGIPQRRTRIFLVGHNDELNISPPESITAYPPLDTLFKQFSSAITVKEALSDLPPITNGEDGSHKDYIKSPDNPYHKFMRSFLTAEDYLKSITSHNSVT